MSPTALAFLGLTALVVVLAAVLVYAFVKFAAALRDSRRAATDTRSASLVFASALEEALTTVKAEARAASARAEASERLSRQIVASLTSGLIVVDAARRVQIVNPAARRILRVDDTSDPTDLLSAIPALDHVVAECLSRNEAIVRRAITIVRDGETMHLGVTVSPLDSEGQHDGAICLFSDLTQVVALEEQLRLKEALARLGELTAGLAHEFRNGLATIHGYGRLLNPEAFSHPQRDYIQGIRSETQALGEVVTNFLKFARPEPLSCVPVQLRTVVARAAEDVPAAQVSLSGEFAVVSADDVLLRQAFSNLFRNSVEACHAIDRRSEIRVESRIDERLGATVLTVSDNGPGIAVDALDKVFQPFFTTRPNGTGLGLAIVQKVIVSHNGRITAANHPHGGASFTITFPVVG
jgi:two-component system, NtrC family, sensor histidine kinase AtoS